MYCWLQTRCSVFFALLVYKSTHYTHDYTNNYIFTDLSVLCRCRWQPLGIDSSKSCSFWSVLSVAPACMVRDLSTHPLSTIHTFPHPICYFDHYCLQNVKHITKMHSLTCGTSFILLFVFLNSLLHHHHPALLHRHALILDQLLTFLTAFSTLILKPSFSRSISFHSHPSLAWAHLLEFDH